MNEAFKIWNELKEVPVNNNMEIDCNFIHFGKRRRYLHYLEVDRGKIQRFYC